MQISEALGSVNRYYFWLKHQREPIDENELVLFYVEQGGAKAFAQKHRKERPNGKAKT